MKPQDKKIQLETLIVERITPLLTIIMYYWICHTIVILVIL